MDDSVFSLVVKTSDITHKKILASRVLIITLRHVWFSLLKPQKRVRRQFQSRSFIYNDYDLKWFWSRMEGKYM